MPPKKPAKKAPKKKAKQEIRIATQEEIEKEAKLLEFWKSKILEAFTLYVKDRPGCVEKKYILSIMRYLIQFASEVQFSEEILAHVSYTL